MSRMEFCNIGTKRAIFISKIHIDSFNYTLTQGLYLIINNLLNFIPVYIFPEHKKNISIIGLYVSKPYLHRKGIRYKIIPRESKELKTSYKSDILAAICNNFFKKKIILKIGKIPTMTKSLKCNLLNLSFFQLIELDEECLEIGGYFVTKGLEKIIRLLLIPKRNIIHVTSRISNLTKHKSYTTLSCSIRSVDKTQQSKTLHLHYLISGNIHARMIIKGYEFFIPVLILLKSLSDISDKLFINLLSSFDLGNKYLRQRAMNMIRDAYCLCDISCQKNIKIFLGKILKLSIHPCASNIEISEIFLSRYVFIHLGSDLKAKSELLFFMIKRLLFVYKGNDMEDNNDSLISYEILLPGHLYLLYLKERFETSIYNYFENKIKKNKKSLTYLKSTFNSIIIGIEKLISSGNMHLNFKEEMVQTKGLSILLEKINFGRFISYFRSIHRGKNFIENKKIVTRKVFPTSWGFVCPVHTPDGTLCGILNHLSLSVSLSQCNSVEKKKFQRYLVRNGFDMVYQTETPRAIPVLLDGKIIGKIKNYRLKWIIDKLRSEKISKVGIISKNIEIFYTHRMCSNGLFSNCFFSSEEGRLVRPIFLYNFNLKKKIFFKKKNQFNIGFERELEITGLTEQFLINIHSLENENKERKAIFFWTHLEIDTSVILSVVAGMTPFSDLNQSPRNTYQCQMAKQSMGFSFYAFWRKSDMKTYLLMIPQIPICRNKVVQDGLQLDTFPMGVNAIVAVLCYTGFDMEDGITINKFSIDRGFFMSKIMTISNFQIKKNFEKKIKYEIILPSLGKCISYGDIIFTNQIYKNLKKNKNFSIYYDSYEKSIIDDLKISSKKKRESLQIEYFTKLRFRRRPFVGDKFASRHGQKGVLSKEYPFADMPFSEIGIVPDIIFNPHGFPSRMTIGVILESLVGKMSIMNGAFYDSSSFRIANKYLGIYQSSEALRDNGLQFYGNEIFYSGYTGNPFQIEIYNGIIQYQRLKHMVNDKFQVSETSPLNSVTRQPTKGRKIGGAIRFGEMERDVLVGHGSMFLLHDRLQLASDLHSIKLNIKSCDIFNNVDFSQKKSDLVLYPTKSVFLPYAAKFLITELCVLNLKINFNCADS